MPTPGPTLIGKKETEFVKAFVISHNNDDNNNNKNGNIKMQKVSKKVLKCNLCSNNKNRKKNNSAKL